MRRSMSSRTSRTSSTVMRRVGQARRGWGQTHGADPRSYTRGSASASRPERKPKRGAAYAETTTRPTALRRRVARRRPEPSASGRRCRCRRRARVSSAQRAAQRVDRLRDEAVVRPRASPARVDETRLAEDLEMVRDRRLRELERRREIADTDLVRSRENVDDRHAGRIGERLEPRCELLARVTVERLDLRATADRLKNGQGLHRWISMYHPRPYDSEEVP